MKERAIICILLLLIAYIVCGCKEQPQTIISMEDGECTIECECGFIYCVVEGVDGVAVRQTYSYTNSSASEIVDCNFLATEPNTASYRTFFGLE